MERLDGIVGMNLVVANVASKWAVRGMTKIGATELGQHGIRVNSAHPGFIVDTELATAEGGDASAVHSLIDGHSPKLARLGPAGKPDEIARVALFFASEESSYCTGSEFVADAGMIAGVPAPGTT
jgi:3alpha(or 20beta)-hydroxysteroid dehydrogenase